MPEAEPPGQCSACLIVTEDLTSGRCSDRAACEERQPTLFGASPPIQ